MFLTLESDLLTCLQFNIMFLHISVWNTAPCCVMRTFQHRNTEGGDNVCTKGEMGRILPQLSFFANQPRLSFFCKSASWLCLCGLDAPPASIEGDQMSSNTGFVLLGSFSQFPNDQVK